MPCETARDVVSMVGARAPDLQGENPVRVSARDNFVATAPEPNGRGSAAIGHTDPLPNEPAPTRIPGAWRPSDPRPIPICRRAGPSSPAATRIPVAAAVRTPSTGAVAGAS